METQSSKERIRSFVIGHLARSREHAEIDYDDNLIISGIIDSLGIIQLIDYLEQSFSIKIKDEDMVPENFETIDRVAHYIHNIQ